MGLCDCMPLYVYHYIFLKIYNFTCIYIHINLFIEKLFLKYTSSINNGYCLRVNLKSHSTFYMSTFL